MDKVSPIYNNIVQQIKSAILETRTEGIFGIKYQKNETIL